jgi:hypothetical protein
VSSTCHPLPPFSWRWLLCHLSMMWPHLLGVLHVHMSPRRSALHDFCSRKEVLSTPKPPIRDSPRSFCSNGSPLAWIQWSRSLSLFPTTWDETKNLVCPPNSRTPNSQNDPTTWVETISMDLIDHDQWFTLILDIRVVSSSNS